MPKVKVPRKSTSVDMTAMTDVAFLLLTFFMLATKFKPDEPVVVDTPSSISEIKLPETDIMLITIDKEGRVFFGIDGQNTRAELLNRMTAKYKLQLSADDVKEFSLLSSFGAPISQLKQYVSLKSEQRADFDKKTTGIPCDSLNNELADWIWQARLANNNLRVAIKGDRETSYKAFKNVVNTLQDKKVNRFNFITSMERAGE
ncbi:MAG: ExbD/TolR family protein [Bacteroidota bacterium]|jgi:biopolymer transport protein ExbD